LLTKWNFSDSAGVCGLGLKVGDEGDFRIIFMEKRHQIVPLLLSNGAF
jgi:hypothetical protein